MRLLDLLYSCTVVEDIGGCNRDVEDQPRSGPVCTELCTLVRVVLGTDDSESVSAGAVPAFQWRAWLACQSVYIAQYCTMGIHVS